ncbi:hypothetical protein, partial [Methanoculleus chikugoensis]|uniref:hypothetical protein n=1 Tax=Methanoculleus chikugoensis TaxID=118126 RepID=UPI001FB54DEA
MKQFDSDVCRRFPPSTATPRSWNPPSSFGRPPGRKRRRIGRPDGAGADERPHPPLPPVDACPRPPA